jgi:hypothetical protein
MRFLSSVAGYRRIDKKRNTDIRLDLKIDEILGSRHDYYHVAAEVLGYGVVCI